MSKRTTTVQKHASCPRQVVLLEPLLLHDLLRRDVAGRKQDRRGDALREQRPRRQSGLVPANNDELNFSKWQEHERRGQGQKRGQGLVLSWYIEIRYSPTKHGAG